MMTIAQNSKRAAPGRPFPPGVSGNPGGRPKGLAAYVRERSSNGRALIEMLFRIASGRDPEFADFKAADRLRAIEMLLDRGFGKPTQSVKLLRDGVRETMGEYADEMGLNEEERAQLWAEVDAIMGKAEV